jgi:hypothetical protein
VLLISWAGPPVVVSSLYPDNGLASLAGVLAAAGHEALVLDLNTVSSFARLASEERTAGMRGLWQELSAGGLDPARVRRFKELEASFEADLDRCAAELAEEVARQAVILEADLVGLKLWSGDGLRASARIGAAVRRQRPAARLVGGGPAVLYSEELLFDLLPGVEALVDGEGELAILGLAAWAEGRGALADVPNLILPGGGRTARALVPDLDALPPPAYDLEAYPSLAGDEHIKLFVLDESRGCPMGCAFCVHQGASGRSWRLRRPEGVAAEMGRLADLHATRAFRLGGSYTPGRFYEGLIATLRESRTDVRFSGFGHPLGLPQDHLEDLRASGCSSLFLGVESFVPDELARLGKRMDPNRAAQAVRDCVRADIAPIVSMIVPAPGQTPAGLAENLRICKELCRGRRAAVGVQFPGLLPRTPWWRERARHGFELSVPEDAYRRLLATYQIRHIVPPLLWAPLPYTLDGLDFAGYAAVASGFQRELAADGVLINMSDDILLLAEILGMTPADFRTATQAMLITVDAPALGDFVRRSNQALRPHE